jgi:hypothetical protein
VDIYNNTHALLINTYKTNKVASLSFSPAWRYFLVGISSLLPQVLRKKSYILYKVCWLFIFFLARIVGCCNTTSCDWFFQYLQQTLIVKFTLNGQLNVVLSVGGLRMNATKISFVTGNSCNHLNFWSPLSC